MGTLNVGISINGGSGSPKSNLRARELYFDLTSKYLWAGTNNNNSKVNCGNADSADNISNTTTNTNISSYGNNITVGNFRLSKRTDSQNGINWESHNASRGNRNLYNTVTYVDLKQVGKIVLDGTSYGNSLPPNSEGEEGQLFFLLK